jgi:hypothetical protein
LSAKGIPVRIVDSPLFIAFHQLSEHRQGSLFGHVQKRVQIRIDFFTRSRAEVASSIAEISFLAIISAASVSVRSL